MAKIHLRNLVLEILLWIGTEQHLYAREEAVVVEPDLGFAAFEAQQAQFWIVLAALELSCDEGISPPLNGGTVIVDRQSSVDRGEEVMPLGDEVQEELRASAGRLDEGDVWRRRTRSDRLRRP